MLRHRSSDSKITWSRRLIAISLILLAISFVGILVLGSYFNEPITSNFSYPAADGWCNPSQEGLGKHCFGDFQAPRVVLEKSLNWNDNGHQNLPPTSFIPHKLVSYVEKFTSVRTSLIVFLLFLVLVPTATYSYYSLVLLPIFAFLFVPYNPVFDTSPSVTTSKMDEDESVPHWWKWLIIFAMSLSLAPLPFVGEVRRQNYDTREIARQSFAIENFGIIWTAVVLSTLVLMVKNELKHRGNDTENLVKSVVANSPYG